VIRDLWSGLEPFIPSGGRLRAAVLAVESLVAGILEALLLVLVVTTTLAIVGEAGSGSGPDLPLINTSLAPGQALFGAALAGVVMVGLHLHVSYLTARLSADVLAAARQRLIASFAGARWSRQSDEREGALQETSSVLAQQTANLVGHLSAFASAGLGLTALLLAAVVVDLVVTLVVLGFGAALFVALRPIGHLTQRRSREYVDLNSRLGERMSEWGTMAMELRVFGVSDVEVERLAMQNRAAAQALVRTRFISRAGGEIFRDLAILFMVGAAAGLHLMGDVNIGSVGSVVLLIVRSLSYAQMGHGSLQQMNEQTPNLEELRRRIESLEAAQDPVGDLPLDVIRSVELAGVSYAYTPGRPALDGVDLRIDAGQVLGIIGPSGGGKSTLVQVLLRLRTPDAGVVRVSGIPYETIAPEAWHRAIALVPQEPKLFRASVADNIAFLRSDVTGSQIEEAAASAHVVDDIRQLPDGFDTVLGPRGAGLSGGQKQRVAIARALVGKPQLLVLDEPTSALDVRSERLLQRTIEELKGDVTLVIVAHRLTTLTCCDRVAVLEGGRVTIVGTLDEALAHVDFTPQVAPPPATPGT
jgi:ATP-binding cassette, subfamily B, bacterial